jgi:hypothetical protein
MNIKYERWKNQRRIKLKKKSNSMDNKKKIKRWKENEPNIKEK